jgi:hypothetical protein
VSRVPIRSLSTSDELAITNGAIPRLINFWLTLSKLSPNSKPHQQGSSHPPFVAIKFANSTSLSILVSVGIGIIVGVAEGLVVGVIEGGMVSVAEGIAVDSTTAVDVGVEVFAGILGVSVVVGVIVGN